MPMRQLEEMVKQFAWDDFAIARPFHVCMMTHVPQPNFFIFKMHFQRGPLELHVAAATVESALCQAIAGWLTTNGTHPEEAQEAGEKLRRALMN